MSADRIALLQPVCSTDSYRQNLSVPFSAEFWGKKWVVATDGHALAAFQCEEALMADGTPPDIASPGEHECEDCGGTGSCVELRYGRIAGGVLNRNLLSRVLKSALAEGDVPLAKVGDLHPFVLRAGDWMAAIMPIRPGSSDASDVKEEFAALVPVGG